jgi:hypothetical protein
MIRRIACGAAALLSLALLHATSAQAFDPYAITQGWSQGFANNRSWHGPYYYQQYGAPTALVVPPTVHMETVYSWGVSQNLAYPIHHQFGRNLPSGGYGGGFYPTPYWPSHTDQFGVYYVRGPWR